MKTRLPCCFQAVLAEHQECTTVISDQSDTAIPPKVAVLSSFASPEGEPTAWWSPSTLFPISKTHGGRGMHQGERAAVHSPHPRRDPALCWTLTQVPQPGESP